jgi:hypothetical protein
MLWSPDRSLATEAPSQVSFLDVFSCVIDRGLPSRWAFSVGNQVISLNFSLRALQIRNALQHETVHPH